MPKKNIKELYEMLFQVWEVQKDMEKLENLIILKLQNQIKENTKVEIKN